MVTWRKKRAILTESFADGVVISEVARRHGLRPQQLFTWRSEFRKRGLARFCAGPDREAAPESDVAVLRAVKAAS